MVSKNLLVTAVLVGMSSVNVANATGIPVFCYNCQESTNNAAHTIADAIRLQTEALLNADDYVMRTTKSMDVAIAASKGVTEQRIQNAYKMDPSMAKPRLACSQSATSGVRSGSAGASTGLRKALVSKTASSNARAANLPPGESRKEYSITKVIDILGEEDAKPAEVVMSQAPIPNNAAAIAEHRKTKDATVNPFPVELPPEEEIERIKKHGSQGEREGLAQMYSLMARQISAQSILDEDDSNRIQFIKSDAFKDQLSYMVESMDDETKKLWTTGQLSNYQIEEMAANYRAMSPTWIKQMSASASSEAVMKELVFELAEMLKQQSKTNYLLRQANILAALKETREVSKDGLQVR